MHLSVPSANKSKIGIGPSVGASRPPGGKPATTFRSPRSKNAMPFKHSPYNGKKRSPRGKSSSSDMETYISDILSKETSTLLMEGQLSKVGRSLCYAIREFPGSYFSLTVIVQESLQKWTVYIPVTEDMVDLLHMWELSPRHRNMKLISGWILSCTNLEFMDDVIIGATFDHNKLRERALSELMRFVNGQVVKVQAVTRGFTARRKLLSHENRTAKKSRSPFSSNHYKHRGNTEDSLLYGSALEDNSLTSNYSLGSYRMGGTAKKMRHKFTPSPSYHQSVNYVHGVYAAQHSGDSDYEVKKPKVKQEWNDSTVIHRSRYRSEGRSHSEGRSSMVRRAQRRKSATKKRYPHEQRRDNYSDQNGSQSSHCSQYYSEEDTDDRGMTLNHLESSGMMSELLDMRSDISEALDIFRVEMNTLRAGLCQQLQIQDSPMAVQSHSPQKSVGESPTDDLSSPRDEVATLRQEMKFMLNEMKELHQHMNKLRDNDIAAMHRQQEASENDVTPSLALTPENDDPVRIGSYSTTITDFRPLTGTDAGPKSRVRMTNMAELQHIGPNTEYRRPNVYQEMNSVNYDADSRPHAEILKDIETAALDPSIDAKIRQEESEQLAKLSAEELCSGNTTVRLQFAKEAEKFGTSNTQLQEIMEDISETYSPIVLREAVVGALMQNDMKLAEKVAVRLLFIVSRIISNGTSFHYVVDTVLPRFDSAVASLQQFSSNRAIVKAYVEIMALVIASANTDFVVEEYGTAGMCNVLLDLADNVNDDEDLVMQIILLCCRLTSSSVKNRHRMGSIQNCRIVADLCTRYQNNQNVLTKITRLLCNICTQAPVNVDNMGEVGMCERLLECTMLNCDDSKVLNLMSRATLLLCYNNHTLNQRRFASTRGFDIFFHCLKSGAGGSGAAFKQICMVIMGVCGTDWSILDQLPVGSMVSLTKQVFALNSGVSDAVVKAALTLVFNFCANVTLRTALNKAGIHDLLSRLQAERNSPDMYGMIGMCARRLCGVKTATDSIAGTPVSNTRLQAMNSRENSKLLQTVTENGQTRAALLMASYQRPHILQSQKSGDLDTNHMRSAEVLRNIERAATDSSIEKRLRERDAKEMAEQKAIDASEKLRRSVKEAEDRRSVEASATILERFENLGSNTNDPVLLRKAVNAAVTVNDEAMTEKTLHAIMVSMGNSVGTREMAAYVDEFESFDGISPAWRMFPDNLAVVKCCVEIMSLLFVSVEAADMLVEEAGRAGMCDVIVDSIVLGVDDHDLAMQTILLGCRMTNTCHRNRYRMGTYRNCEIIGNLFMSFINAKPVLTKLCRLCGNLAVNAPTVLDTLGDAGVCNKVLQCMHYNRFDRYSLNLLAKLVLLLSDNNHKNLQLFNSPRGFEVCISCLDTSRLSDPETFRQICMMIMALFGTSPVSLDLLPAAQTAEAFKSVIDDDQLDELSLKVVLSVLYNFTVSAPLRSSLNQIGMRELLSQISSTSTDQDIVSSALMILRQLDGLSTADSSSSYSVPPTAASGPWPSIPPSTSSQTARGDSRGAFTRLDEEGQSVIDSTSNRSSSGPVESKSKVSQFLGHQSIRSLAKSSSPDNADKKLKYTDLLRNIERAAADPSIDLQVREQELKQIEAQRDSDAKEKLRRSTQLIINKQRQGTSAGTPIRAIEFDHMIGVTDDPKTLRESLLTALLLNNQEIVEKSLDKIFTLLKRTASNKTLLQKAEIIFSTFDSLMNSLRQFAQNREIVMCSIGCLSIILEASNNSFLWVEEAGRSGLCDYLIDTCRMDEAVSDLSLKVCTALTNTSVENKHRMGTRHNCEVIGDLFIQYKRNVLVVLRLSRFLENISVESPTVLDNLGISGVCEKIIECVDANSSNNEIISVLSKTILLFCYNNHSGNRLRFASARGAEVFMRCLVTAMVPGGGETFKQLCMMIMGVFGTVPDSLHLISPKIIGEIARNVVLQQIELDDAHLKATLVLIYNFGGNSNIRAALLSAGIQDALIEMQTASHMSGVPRMALLAFRRITTLDTRGSVRSGSAQRGSRSGGSSGHAKGRATSVAPVAESLPQFGTKVDAGSDDASHPSSLGNKEESSKNIELSTPTALTDKRLLQSPHRPAVSSSSVNAAPNRVPRKVVERSYTAVSESDPLFKNMPDIQSEVLKEEEGLLRAEVERRDQEVSGDEAVRRIQRNCRIYLDRKRKDHHEASLKFRVAALLEMVEKSQDEAILISCMDVAVEAHNKELATNALKRCNAVIKHAKENKINSILVVKLLDKSAILMDLMNAFMDDSVIIMISTELMTRVSYAGGACDAFGKAGVFEVFYAALNTYLDNAVLVGALLVCGVRLTSKKTSNKKRAGTREGFQSIVNIYKHHLDNTTIVDRLTRYTCNCIDNMPTCQDYFREAGGCDVIVDIYTFGPEHLESMEMISRMVMNLTALNNVENMKVFGTRKNIAKYFDGLAISSMSRKVFRSIAMMICNVFSKAELFVDILPNCDMPNMLASILDFGNRSTGMDRQEVIFAALMVVQFFGGMEILKPALMSSKLPSIIVQYTDKAYAKRIQKAASLINRLLRGDAANSEMSDTSSVKTR